MIYRHDEHEFTVPLGSDPDDGLCDLIDLWPVGPLTAEEREEQDRRFEVILVAAEGNGGRCPGRRYGVWDAAYRELIFVSGAEHLALRRWEEVTVQLALWEERIARGEGSPEETEAIVTDLWLRSAGTVHTIRSTWLGLLRLDDMQAELQLEAFLRDTRALLRNPLRLRVLRPGNAILRVL